VPHISLVFREMWDTAGLPLKPIAAAPVRTSVARIFYPQGPQIEEANPLSWKSLSARKSGVERSKGSAVLSSLFVTRSGFEKTVRRLPWSD
jgi:hypothetical protein